MNGERPSVTLGRLEQRVIDMDGKLDYFIVRQDKMEDCQSKLKAKVAGIVVAVVILFGLLGVNISGVV